MVESDKSEIRCEYWKPQDKFTRVLDFKENEWAVFTTLKLASKIYFRLLLCGAIMWSDVWRGHLHVW